MRPASRIVGIVLVVLLLWLPAEAIAIDYTFGGEVTLSAAALAPDEQEPDASRLVPELALRGRHEWFDPSVALVVEHDIVAPDVSFLISTASIEFFPNPAWTLAFGRLVADWGFTSRRSVSDRIRVPAGDPSDGRPLTLGPGELRLDGASVTFTPRASFLASALVSVSPLLTGGIAEAGRLLDTVAAIYVGGILTPVDGYLAATVQPSGWLAPAAGVRVDLFGVLLSVEAVYSLGLQGQESDGVSGGALASYTYYGAVAGISVEVAGEYSFAGERGSASFSASVDAPPVGGFSTSLAYEGAVDTRELLGAHEVFIYVGDYVDVGAAGSWSWTPQESALYDAVGVYARLYL